MSLKLFEQRQRGVTLIELVVTISILGILASIAVPAYQDYVLRQKWKGAAEAVLSLAMQAKRAAISNNETVYLVVKGAGTSSWCVTYSVSSGSPSVDCSGGYVASTANNSVRVDGGLYENVVLYAVSGGIIGFQMPSLIALNPQKLSVSSALGVYTIEVNEDMLVGLSK